MPQLRWCCWYLRLWSLILSAYIFHLLLLDACCGHAACDPSYSFFSTTDSKDTSRVDCGTSRRPHAAPTLCTRSVDACSGTYASLDALPPSYWNAASLGARTTWKKCSVSTLLKPCQDKKSRSCDFSMPSGKLDWASALWCVSTVGKQTTPGLDSWCPQGALREKEGRCSWGLSCWEMPGISESSSNHHCPLSDALILSETFTSSVLETTCPVLEKP